MKTLSSLLYPGDDSGYNNVLNNLSNIFDYEVLDKSYFADALPYFEEFVVEFNDYIKANGRDTSEYRNMNIPDIGVWFKEYMNDFQAEKIGISLFYDAVYNVYKGYLGEPDSDSYDDMILAMYRDYEYEFAFQDEIIRDNLTDEYPDLEDEDTDVLDEIAYEIREINPRSDCTFEPEDGQFVTGDIYVDEYEDQLDFSAPYDEEYDFARDCGSESIYYDWYIYGDLVKISIGKTVYYTIDKSIVDDVVRNRNIAGLETLFNSRQISSKIAYHSTRQRKLKKFDDVTDKSKARTGEGAMVHGWGLYLQEDEELNIRDYKNRLGRGRKSIVPDTIEVDGVEFTLDRDYNQWSSEDNSLTKLESLCLTSVLVLGSVEAVLEKMDDGETYRKASMFGQAREFFSSHEITEPRIRHMDYGVSQYKVEIPDDFVFIEEGRDIGDEFYESLELEPMHLKTDKGDDVMSYTNTKKVYEALSTKLGGDEYASKYLYEHGINGIHYDGDRDDWCYVIFNCERLRIVGEE